MPYVSPGSVHTPTTGAAPPAGWGTAVNDGFDWLADDRPRARVYRSSLYAHSSSGNNVAIPFNAERYDVGGCHSTSSNTSRLTVPSGGGGMYHIGGSLHFVFNGTGLRILSIMVNGSTSIVSSSNPGDSNYGNYLSVSTDYELAAGDYVELVAYQDSGGALNITANVANTPEFWFHWVCNVQ